MTDSQGKVIYNESNIRDNNLRLDLKDASAGIYMLSPSAIEHIPENEFYHITSLIRKLLKEKLFS